MPGAGAELLGVPAMMRSALASAARSKESDGSLREMPVPVGVPETGPFRCWTTCVSSWASVR